jgi:beta-glucosidase
MATGQPDTDTAMKTLPGYLHALLLAFALSLATVSCERDLPADRAVRPVDATTPFRNQHEPERIEEVARLAQQPNVDLVFLGDSLTHYWNRHGKEVWEKFYGKRRTVNLGIGWSETGNILWRIRAGHFDTIKPRLIVLMIGTNNTQHGGHTPQQISNGIIAIVEELLARMPDTKILVLGIFPRGTSIDDPYRQNNEETNSLISRIADGRRIFFKDIGHVFLNPDGSVNQELMADPVHLNTMGYQAWAEAIEDDISQILGDSYMRDSPASLDR